MRIIMKNHIAIAIALMWICGNVAAQPQQPTPECDLPYYPFFHYGDWPTWYDEEDKVPVMHDNISCSMRLLIKTPECHNTFSTALATEITVKRHTDDTIRIVGVAISRSINTLQNYNYANDTFFANIYDSSFNLVKRFSMLRYYPPDTQVHTFHIPHITAGVGDIVSFTFGYFDVPLVIVGD